MDDFNPLYGGFYVCQIYLSTQSICLLQQLSTLPARPSQKRSPALEVNITQAHLSLSCSCSVQLLSADGYGESQSNILATLDTYSSVVCKKPGQEGQLIALLNRP